MANQVAGSQTKLAADVAQLQTDVESLNSNFNQRGQKTLLAVCNAVDDFTLEDSIQNYKYIFVRLGYYNSGYANYGTAMIPVSDIDVNTDTVYAQRIVGYASSNQVIVDLLFTSNTTVKVITKQNVNVARVWGIK